MGDTMGKVMDTAGKAAQGAARMTSKLVASGRQQASRMGLTARLGKLYKQLGSVVYALNKNGEENAPLIAYYVHEIDKVKRQLSKLQAPRRPDVTVVGDAEASEDAMFCGCGCE